MSFNVFIQSIDKRSLYFLQRIAVAWSSNKKNTDMNRSVLEEKNIFIESESI